MPVQTELHTRTGGKAATSIFYGLFSPLRLVTTYELGCSLVLHTTPPLPCPDSDD